MMTNERIEYFRKAKKLTYQEREELNNDYFRQDKTSWFSERNGKQQWDNKKTVLFWILFRKHITPKDFRKTLYIDGFVFPEISIDQRRVLLVDKNARIPNKRSFLFGSNRPIITLSITLNNCTFLANVSVIGVCFSKEIIFQNCNFLGLTYFHNLTFLKETHFQFVNFNSLKIQYFKHSPPFRFENMAFSNETVFREIDLSNTIFNTSDITNIQFKSCRWPINNRILLKDEIEFSSSTKSTRTFEDLYRQLKKNFENSKDWELAGMAYVSEMEMRKKRLWYDGEYYHWFIYWFYGFFGGYTQNIKKPILSLAGLIVVFSTIYYFMDYDLFNTIQRSFKGSLPLMKTNIEKEIEFYGWWTLARNIETLLGGTFLSFFILALRKRFKQ